MFETTLNASALVGGIGTSARAAPVSRGRRATSRRLAAQGSSTQGVAAPEIVSGQIKAGALVESMSDPQLVERILAGDQELFAVLVERYKDAVHNLAYRMLSNVTEAEDITQEAFVRAYTQLATYKPTHKFSTWLLSIASHLAIDLLRKRRFLALPLEDVPFLEWIVDMGISPEQSALQGEQKDEIQEYLQRLPGKYRAVLVLRYWYDFSYEEIANALGLTSSLVKARLHRARELLARLIPPRTAKEPVDALS